LERYQRGDSFWGLNQGDFLAMIEMPDHKKYHLVPQNGPGSLGPETTAKNSKLPKNCFESVGIGGWPPISTLTMEILIFQWYNYQSTNCG
jgi:hypothetical protein